MTVHAVVRAVGLHHLPGSVRLLSSLPRTDYADYFTLATDADASPERWARAMFGDTPSAGQLFIWRMVLGLRLSRGPSPHTVAGWWIGGRGEDWIRLEAASWFLAANLVVQATGGQVALGTFIRYDRPLANRAWPALSAIHRYLVPGVLHKAVNRVSRSRDPHIA